MIDVVCAIAQAGYAPHSMSPREPRLVLGGSRPQATPATIRGTHTPLTIHSTQTHAHKLTQTQINGAQAQ